VTTFGALLALATLAPGCEVRDVTVFERASGGAAGTGGTSDAAGTAGAAGLGNATSGEGGSAGVAGTENGGFTSDVAGAAGTLAGSGGSAPGMVCRSKADCPQGWSCEKASCEAAEGLCDLNPAKSNLDYQPVCGCDGVNYWNDATRRQAGATLRQADQCSTTARQCDGSADCGDSSAIASCARLAARDETCSPSRGACWVLPFDCPDPRSDPDIWQECRPPMPGVPPPPCVDTCRAIRSEHPHQRPRDLKMCP
jgi:hypothetical protein